MYKSKRRKVTNLGHDDTSYGYSVEWSNILVISRLETLNDIANVITWFCRKPYCLRLLVNRRKMMSCNLIKGLLQSRINYLWRCYTLAPIIVYGNMNGRIKKPGVRFTIGIRDLQSDYGRLLWCMQLPWYHRLINQSFFISTCK